MRTTVGKGVEGYKAAFEAQRQAEIDKVRPKDAAGYEVKLPKAFDGKMQIHVGNVDASKLDPKIGHYKLDTADPMLGWWRDTCFKMGLGQEAFQEGLGAFAQSMIARQPDFNAEMQKLGDGGKVRIDNAKNWLQANTSETTFKLFERVASTAAGVAAIEEMIAKAGGPKLTDNPGSAPPPAADNLSEGELLKMMNDPKYYDPGQRDPAFVKKVKDGWAKLKPGVTRGSVKSGAAAA